MRAWAFIGLVSIACGGARVNTASDGAEVVAIDDLPTGASISEAYRFALRPVDGWRLLTEDELGAWGSSAAAGSARTDGTGWGAVVVESVPGLSLERAAELTLTGFPEENRRLVSQQPTHFLGLPAIRQVVTADVQEMPIRWVNLLFIHNDHLYRLTVWGDGLAESARIETFYRSFALLDGQVVRPPRESVQEGEGVDWRVRDGVFESVGAAIGVRADRSWRIVVGSELDEMHSDAVLGLRFDEPDIYAIVISERVPESGYDSLRTFVTRDTTSTLGGSSRGVHTVRFFDRDLTMSVLQFESMEYLFGVHCDAQRCHQLLIWYIGQSAANARARLTTFPNVHALSAGEIDDCTSALASSRRARRISGPNHAYRGNTYVDFRRGLTLRVPERAFWNVRAEGEARDLAELAELHLKNQVLGVDAIFMTEQLEMGADRAEYHDMVRTSVGVSNARSRVARFGALAVDVTEGTRDMGFGAFQFRIATTVIAGQGYRFVFWGWPPFMENARGDIDALLSGAELTGGPIQPYVLEGNRFVDQRFGWALTLAVPGFVHRDITPPHIRGVSSMHGFEYPDGSIVAVTAMQAPMEGSRASAYVARTMRDAFSRDVHGDWIESTGTLAGREADVSRMPSGPVELRVITAGNLSYGLMVAGRGDAEAFARTFQLLP